MQDQSLHVFDRLAGEGAFHEFDGFLSHPRDGWGLRIDRIGLPVDASDEIFQTILTLHGFGIFLHHRHDDQLLF